MSKGIVLWPSFQDVDHFILGAEQYIGAPLILAPNNTNSNASALPTNDL